MNEMFSSGGAAKELGMSRDSLLFALRTGAPQPKAPRVANRRMFSKGDIERLRKWFSERRKIGV